MGFTCFTLPVLKVNVYYISKPKVINLLFNQKKTDLHFHLHLHFST